MNTSFMLYKVRYLRLALVGMAAAGLLLANGCAAISDIANQLRDVGRMKFRLADVAAFQVAGVTLSDKRSISDVSMTDALRLTQAFGRKRLPIECTVNVLARRPEGSRGSSTSSPLTLSSLDWTLLIDGKQTIAGNIGAPVTLPQGTLEAVVPVQVRLDIMEFFGDRSYDDVVRLLFAIGGVEGSAARLQLRATPEVRSSLGTYRFPSPVTIVDSQFSE